MPEVCGQVVDDLIYNCDDKSSGGLEQELKLVNLSVLKAHLSEFTVGDTSLLHTVSAFSGDPATLAATKVVGIPNKQLLKAGFSTSETDFGTFTSHTIDIWAQSLTEKSALFLKSLINGAEVVAFVKQKTTSNSIDETYWIYGFNQGLKLADTAFNTAENNGSIIVPLSSREPDLEPVPPYRLLLTDIAATKVFFDAL